MPSLMLPHRISRLFLFMLCFGWSMSIFAQTSYQLSLSDLVAQALEKNYQIQLFRNIALTAKNRNTIGNAGMLPTVDINAEQRSNIRNSRQQFFTGDSQQASNAKSNSSSASLDVNWIVFDGLAMFARRDQLAQLEALSQVDIRFFMEQTVADLSTAYYQLQQENLLLDAFRKSMDVSRARLVFAEKAYEIGSSSLLDVELARVDRNTDSSLIVNQQIRVQELMVAINRLINQDMTATIIPTDNLVLTSTFDLPALLASARTKNTALSQQQLQELIALSQFDIVKGGLLPEVQLYGSYSYNRQANEVGFLESSRTFGPEYGIRVRFNLFAGGQQKIAVENAQINIETEKLRTQDLQQEVEESLRLAYLRWRNFSQQAKLEEASVAAANRALAIAQGKYELGALTNIDFRVIQINALNAETRFLEAQFAAKIQEVELLRLSGALL